MNTQDIELHSTEITPDEEGAQLDMELIIEQICNDLDQPISRSEIRDMLMEIAPAYEDVRIKTFVPIFLRRDVRQRLQGESTQNLKAEEHTPKIIASGEGDK